MQNQTQESWLSEQSKDGTGVFVFPEEQKSKFGMADWTQGFKNNRLGALQKALVRDLSYAECVDRGEQNWMIGYKWVPQSLANFETVQAESKSCSGESCVQRCARYGCICISGACR